MKKITCLALFFLSAATYAQEPTSLTHWVTEDGVTRFRFTIELKAVSFMYALTDGAKRPQMTFEEAMKREIGRLLSEANLCSNGWRLDDSAYGKNSRIAYTEGYCL